MTHPTTAVTTIDIIIADANTEEDNAEASVFSAAWWIIVIIIVVLLICCCAVIGCYKQRHANDKVLRDLRMHKTALDNPTYCDSQYATVGPGFASETTATWTEPAGNLAPPHPGGSELNPRAGVVVNQMYAVPFETSDVLYMDADPAPGTDAAERAVHDTSIAPTYAVVGPETMRTAAAPAAEWAPTYDTAYDGPTAGSVRHDDSMA